MYQPRRHLSQIKTTNYRVAQNGQYQIIKNRIKSY